MGSFLCVLPEQHLPQLRLACGRTHWLYCSPPQLDSKYDIAILVVEDATGLGSCSSVKFKRKAIRLHLRLISGLLSLGCIYEGLTSVAFSQGPLADTPQLPLVKVSQIRALTLEQVRRGYSV